MRTKSAVDRTLWLHTAWAMGPATLTLRGISVSLTQAPFPWPRHPLLPLSRWCWRTFPLGRGRALDEQDAWLGHQKPSSDSFELPLFVDQNQSPMKCPYDRCWWPPTQLHVSSRAPPSSLPHSLPRPLQISGGSMLRNL